MMSLRLSPLLAGLLALFSASVAGQTTVTLGVTPTTNAFPFNTASMRYQAAYSATEINLPGGATLTEVRVHKNNGTIPTYNNFRLRVAHTTLNTTGTGTLTTTYDSNYSGSLSTAIGDTLPGTSPVNLLPSSVTVGGVEWVRFPFTTNFSYNGTSNLLLDWSFDSKGTGGFSTAGSGRTRVYLLNGNASSVTAGGAADGGNWQVQLIFETGPRLTVAATPGTATSVYSNDTGPGGNGRAAGVFTIASNNQLGVSLNSITIRASGTGNDSNAFSSVAVWYDADDNSAFSTASDTQVGSSAVAFPGDNGDLTFTWGTAQSFPVTTTRRYFVVVRLNGATQASPGHTFNFTVQDITVSGTNASKAGVPSSVMNGLSILTPTFTFADVSPATATTAFLNSMHNVCQAFTIAYPNGPDDKPGSITVTGLGTAHEVTDVDAVQLWYDSDSSGTFSATSDTQIATGNYAADNGTVTFAMTTHSNLPAGSTRRYFVVYNLNSNASDAETFRCYVSAAAAASHGGTMNGLPVPSVTGTAGLLVSANVLSVASNGPGAASSVNSNSQGATGDGELLLDVTLAAAPGGAWTVTSLTFNASGTGSHNTAYTLIALYEDTGNGTWDGAAVDTLAAPTGNFVAGSVTKTLSNSALAAGASRRFFLVGRLNGTATAGQTFNANLQSAVTTPPAGGIVTGIPTGASTALIINAAALTVANGPAVTAPPVHLAGAAQSYVVARWRLTAANANASVTSIAITTAGTGDWSSDVSSVEVYQDNGDGVFSATTDTLRFSGTGAAVVTATFTGFTIQNSTSEDLWVRVGLTATAGQGVAATPESFTLGVQAAADVSVTGGVNVLLGTPNPNSISLGAIEFVVSGFTPLADLPAGGSPITITGSGFMAPLTVTIGGVVCPGTAVITGGTSITGLMVPPGGGTNLPIVVTSSTLPAQTLTQRFGYSGIGVISGGRKGGGGGGCAAATGGGLALPALLVLLCRRRRRNVNAR